MEYAELNVEWVSYESVQPNDYNPNIMSVRDRALLYSSVLEDGWTQPLVVLRGMEGKANIIVDGEQRWTVAGELLPADRVSAVLSDLLLEQSIDEDAINQQLITRLRLAYLFVQSREEEQILNTRLVDLTRGEVPVHFVDFMDDAHAIISTLRHNRARGVHAQVLMIGIVSQLREKHEMSYESFDRRLGMNRKEVDRLVSSLPMPQRLTFPGGETYSKSWEIAKVVDMSPEVRHQIGVQVTPAVEMLSAASLVEQKEREAFVKKSVSDALIDQGYTEEKPAPLLVVMALRQKVLSQLPDTNFPFLRRIIFSLTPEQQQKIKPSFERVIGTELSEETMPAAVTMLCQIIYDNSSEVRQKITGKVKPSPASVREVSKKVPKIKVVEKDV